MNNKPSNETLISRWLSVIIRGVVLRTPSELQIRTHKSWLLVRATLLQTEEEKETDVRPFVEIAIGKCRNFKFTPESTVELADFKGEWPPYQYMKEIDAPQLYAVNGQKLDS